MIRKVFRIVAIALLVVGVGIFTFPYIAQWIFQLHENQVVVNFNTEVSQVAQKYPATDQNAPVPYLSDLYAAMQAYNQQIYANNQADLKDPFSYEEPSFDLTKWGFKENIVGYIDIPRMSVHLPIYLGATTDNMRHGAVQLSQTSLPIGGVNTNSVIAAHRGATTGAFFKDIQLLQVGDPVYITNLWTKLTYKVVQTKVIMPTDIRQVCIQPGKDMITLITCTPYGSNTQRYLVYCERVDDSASASASSAGTSSSSVSDVSGTAGNTAGNLSNTGFAATADNWVYYSNSAGLYKMQTDGTGVQRLSSNQATEINVVGNRIYYVNSNDANKIYTINTDGSDDQKLSDDEADNLTVVGNTIYYSRFLNGGGIYSMNADGGGKQEISSDGASDMNVVGNQIDYCNYSDHGNLYTIRTDGTGKQKLYDGAISCFNATENQIYFSLNSGGIYVMNSDGTGEQEISADSATSLIAAGNQVYYCDDNGGSGGPMYSIQTDGTGKNEVSSDQVMNFNVIGGQIYYFDYHENLLTVTTSGANKQSVS